MQRSENIHSFNPAPPQLNSGVRQHLHILGQYGSMITEHHIERDGERLLLRLLIGRAAALDVLTDRGALRGAAAALRGPSEGGCVARLGGFGPFDVVMSAMDGQQVAISVDGPDLGSGFRGDQSVALYVSRDQLLEILSEE